MIDAIHLLGSSALPLTLLLTRDGQQVTTEFLTPLLVAGISGILLKSLLYLRASGLPIAPAFRFGLIASGVSALPTVPVLLALVNPTWVPMAGGILILFSLWASLFFGKKFDDSPWDLLTPARLGFATAILTIMTAIWTRIGSGIEPSISLTYFNHIRVVTILLSVITASVSAGLWEGAIAITLCEKDQQAKALRGVVYVNLAMVFGCTAWGIAHIFGG
jgi:hypothetical protein